MINDRSSVCSIPQTEYPIKGDVTFTSCVIAFLLAFPALRGWTLDSKTDVNHIEPLVEFIFRGLGMED